MKNTAIEVFCDWGIVFSFCGLIFVLPAAIAYLDSFAALTIFFYLLKKICRIRLDWPLGTSRLNFLGKIKFIWTGFAPPVNILNRPLQFLVLAIFMSVVFSHYPQLSLLAFIGKFLKSVFLYFSFIEAFTDQQRIRVFLGFFMLSAFITCLNGMIQHFTGYHFLKGHNQISTRENSFFYTANGFGAYLLPVIGLVVHFLFTAITPRKSWIWGGVWAIFLGLLLACLCWTYSRSSWIGYLIILFAMVLLDRHKALFAGALLLVFIFIFMPSLNNARHFGLIQDYTGSSNFKGSSPLDMGSILEQGGSGRHNFWKKAVSILRSSPVIGTGFNTYTRIIKQNPDKNTWWYAHNCYLQLAAETGLVGLACFLWMVFVSLSHGLNYCNRITDVWLLTFLQGTVTGLLGFLVQSFFDNTFYTVQLGVLMWVMIGLMVALTRLKV